MRRPAKIELRVLIIEEEGVYNATCLEMGLAAAGPDLETVKRDMLDLIAAHLRACADEGRPQDAFVPAPPEYWQKYAEAVREGACRTQRLIPPSLPRTVSTDLLAHLTIRSFVCSSRHATRR
jgi:hypothetical protein